MGCEQSSEFSATQGQSISPQLEHELHIGKKYDRKVNRPEDNFFTIEDASVEQFAATKPWLGTIKEPTNKPSFDPTPPKQTLQLQFVSGFKVEDSRQNIFWGSKPNTLVYCAGALGIVMDTATLKQKYMGSGSINKADGHSDDVLCLDVNVTRKLAVTGSVGTKPTLILWDTETLAILARANLPRGTRAVSTVRFSEHNKYIFCTDRHNDGNVYCFDSNLKLVGTQKCGDIVIDSAAGTVVENGSFACATKNGVWFFTIKGNEFSKHLGTYNDKSIKITMTSVAFSEEDGCFYSGDTAGYIYIWQQMKCTKRTKLHQSAIMAVSYRDGIIYSSDNTKLILSNYAGDISQSLSVPSYAKSIDAKDNKIVVGTKCGKIIVFEAGKPNVLVQGHWTGQVWGLAIGPDGLIYTTGDDNNILAFNPKTLKVEATGIINSSPGKRQKLSGASTLSVLPGNQQSRAINISKDNHIAVAANDGTLTIRLKSNLNTPIFSANDSKEWIEVMKYSPDGSKLAVGSHDNNIYVYKVAGVQYSLEGVLRGHNSFVTALDWSMDGNALQSCCGAYQLLYWDVSKLKQEVDGATKFKDQKWANLTVKLGWPVQGVFPPGTDGSHVNGVDRSKNGQLLVTGDDWGLVTLYRNPCLNGSKGSSYRGHSSHVMRVLFDSKDGFVYSVGGYDKTLMMWKLTS